MEDQENISSPEELNDENILSENTTGGEPILIDNEPRVIMDLLEKLKLVPDPPMSKHMSEIVTDYRNGEVVSKTMKLITILNNLLSKGGVPKADYIEGSEIYKEFIKSMNYQFHDKKGSELTNEDINEINLKYNDFMIEHCDFIPNLATEAAWEKLDDLISILRNNNDPYQFLIFSETFDPKILSVAGYPNKYLREKYDYLVNHPVVKQKLESYRKWKDLIDTLDSEYPNNVFISGVKNKYKIANYYECLDASMKLFEQMHSLEILQKEVCISFLHPILNEMYEELNLWDLVQKYHTATFKRGSLGKPNYATEHIAGSYYGTKCKYGSLNDSKYGDMFIEQYLRPFRIKNEIKLF